MEKVILLQLSYINIPTYPNPYQQSTECALLKVYNEVVLSVDCAILILLNLSAAFDTTGENIPVPQHFTGLPHTCKSDPSLPALQTILLQQQHFATGTSGFHLSCYIVLSIPAFFKENISKSNFSFHLHKTASSICALYEILRFLCVRDCEIVIHALISSQSTAINFTLVSINPLFSIFSLFKMLLLTSHISPVSASLHWLSVRFGIDFKTILFAHKALFYISDLFIQLSGPSGAMLLTVSHS